jgi:DNA-binding phage protein
MARKKISKQHTTSSHQEEAIEGFIGVKRWSPSEELLDKRFILEAITECLLQGDVEGALEVFQIHLRAVNRSKLAKDSHISRSTLEHCLQHRNPTIKTAFKLLSA